MKAKDFFEAVSGVLVTIACIIALVIGAVCTAIYVVRWPIIIGCVMALLLYTSLAATMCRRMTL